jgi:uncharacterized membrane protein HdeD (DUF308 family)
MGSFEASSLPDSPPRRLGGRLLAYAALDLLGMLVLVAGVVPLIDGMPLFFFPATTGEALACVVAGIALVGFAALKIIREVLNQARRDAAKA